MQERQGTQERRSMQRDVEHVERGGELRERDGEIIGGLSVMQERRSMQKRRGMQERQSTQERRSTQER